MPNSDYVSAGPLSGRQPSGPFLFERWQRGTTGGVRRVVLYLTGRKGERVTGDRPRQTPQYGRQWDGRRLAGARAAYCVARGTRAGRLDGAEGWTVGQWGQEGTRGTREGTRGTRVIRWPEGSSSGDGNQRGMSLRRGKCWAESFCSIYSSVTLLSQRHPTASRRSHVSTAGAELSPRALGWTPYSPFLRRVVIYDPVGATAPTERSARPRSRPIPLSHLRLHK